jgi:hypothetical protein
MMYILFYVHIFSTMDTISCNRRRSIWASCKLGVIFGIKSIRATSFNVESLIPSIGEDSSVVPEI